MSQYDDIKLTKATSINHSVNAWNGIVMNTINVIYFSYHCLMCEINVWYTSILCGGSVYHCTSLYTVSIKICILFVALFLAIIITCQNLQFLASMFVCQFVTCQNLQFLASMFVCYLPKFTIFGKYVRLSVCYLPKFFGKYVRLSVCLSVSLSVLSGITHERFDISSPNLVHIWNGSAVPVCNIDK